MNAKDLTGQKFGRLVVLARSGKTNDRHAAWLCRCDCGEEKVVSGVNLRRGITQSCGCLNKEINSQKVKTHGMTRTRLYEEWKGIKFRCYNPKCAEYDRYGGRGITICPEWLHSFESFRDWALANGYQDNLTIERKDNDGPYNPDNCQWITHKDQQRNRSNNRRITYNGETKTLSQWAEETGIPYSTLRARLDHGWSIERSLLTSVDKTRAHRTRIF